MRNGMLCRIIVRLLTSYRYNDRYSISALCITVTGIEIIDSVLSLDQLKQGQVPGLPENQVKYKEDYLLYCLL